MHAWVSPSKCQGRIVSVLREPCENSSADVGGDLSIDVRTQLLRGRAVTFTAARRFHPITPGRERRNLLSTLAAERKKVILYCRREAIKRRTKDIAAGAKEARQMNAHT